MLTLSICIIYLYLGSSFSILVDKMGWFNLTPFHQEKGALFFVRTISWPLLLISIPILLAYEKHNKDSDQQDTAS